MKESVKLASSVISSAALQISKLLVDEAKYLYSVKDKVEALYDELTWMRSFLQDADTREQEEQITRLWVSQIREFEYEAVDIVEEYLHRVSNHRKEGCWNGIKWLSCILCNCCDATTHHEVASNIDGLTQKISGLCSKMQTYGVKNNSQVKISRRRRVMELRRTRSEIQRDEIVGLDDDTKELVKILKESSKKVICISGMGGLGKTTLAQMVYGDVKEEFRNRAWVYVSQQFQTRNILEAILLKLAYIDIEDSRNIKDLRDEELPLKVCQALLKKKCLIVLDDVWTEDDWKELAPAFATLRRSTSKLLLTTRNETLLAHVDGQGHPHKATKLDTEESWQLLRKIALHNEGVIDDQKEGVGRTISDYCEGLPLSLVVVGGILATKSTHDEWKEVKVNIDSFLKNGTNKQHNRIFEVLELSYFDLPCYLKPCFLHLGNFPEDYEIPTKRLYHMWAVEGMVTQPTYTTEEVPMEAIAEDYLNQLVDRCLVQLGRTEKSGKIITCRLHDLIRDMSLKKSKEENFLNVIDHGDFKRQSSRNPSSHINKALHRLAIYTHKSNDGLQHLISDQKTHHVRSLLFFPVGEIQRKLEWPQGKVSKSLKFVRVLDFEDICLRSVPKDIGDLIHLRYLSLKGTRVSYLPSSIAKLVYLQILDLQICDSIDVSIPNVIWKLKRLEHLYFPNNWTTRKGTTAVLFQALAPRVGYKERLRLKCLSQMETLENLRLEECIVKDMVNLTALQQVSFADYVVTEQKCLKSFLECYNIAAGQLKKPLSLAIDGNIISKDPSILASNSRVCFHKLEISGKILIQLDNSRILPQDLKQLILYKCELEADPMPILEKLPHLRELTLGENSFVRGEMVCTSENFRELVVLRLVQLTNLQEWKVGEGAMSHLKNLYVYSCEQLKKIPDELPKEVKIGCRPCIKEYDFERYGRCCYYRPQEAHTFETDATPTPEPEIPQTGLHQPEIHQPSVEDRCSMKGSPSNDPPKVRERAMDKLNQLLKTDPGNFFVEMEIPKEILQYTHTLRIEKEHFSAWLNRKELEAEQISMYIKYLYDTYNPSLHKFFGPRKVADFAKAGADPIKDARIENMANTMNDPTLKDHMWIVPYHKRNYWMLAVINPISSIIYWLDPLRNSVEENFKIFCQAVLNMYHAKTRTPQCPQIEWREIKCPRQNDGTSCGFFICRFMRDIVQAGVAEIPIEYFPPSPSSFINNEIDEVIEECIVYLEHLLDSELKYRE